MALGEILRKARLAKKETTSQVASATQMMTQIVEDLEQEDFSKIAAPIYGKGFIKMYARHVGLDPKPLVDEYVDRFVTPVSRPQPSVRQPDIMNDEPELMEEMSAPPVVEPRAEIVEPALEEETDLFARADIRRKNRVTAPESPRNVEPLIPKIDLSVVQDKLLHTWNAIRELVKRLFGGGAQSAMEKLREISGSWPPPSFKVPKFRVPGISLGDTPAKKISIGVGAVIIAIFLVSGLSRCAHESDEEIAASDDVSEQSLRIAVEPPEPYFD